MGSMGRRVSASDRVTRAGLAESMAERTGGIGPHGSRRRTLWTEGTTSTEAFAGDDARHVAGTAGGPGGCCRVSPEEGDRWLGRRGRETVWQDWLLSCAEHRGSRDAAPPLG